MILKSTLNNLSETSALVLLFAKNTIHTTKNSQKYLKLLDLTPGNKLFTSCKKIWPTYDTVIKNRKKCIINMTLEIIRKSKVSQIVIFGSGMDVLSIELSSKIKNLQIYEIDKSNMLLKNKLIRKTDSKLSNHIHCLDINLQNPASVFNSLLKQGWKKLEPTILIFEGISYYLDEKNLFDLVSLFKTQTRHNFIILEYLVKQKHIAKNRVYIADRIFDIIKEQCDVPVMRYDTDTIQFYMDKINGTILNTFSLQDMEKQRTGKNTIFKTKKSGWIEICEIAI